MKRGLLHDVRLQAALVLLVSAILCWPLLGRSGFSSTEGHRVIPGWEMREPVVSGPPGNQWLVPRLFGQVYLRKPPGMPWAVAASAAVLGESESSARAVSALCAMLAALVSFVFATRWFGSPWGLAAGLCHALTPWFWSPARAAEIEALNNLATHTAALLVLDITLGPRCRTGFTAAARAILLALAIIAAGLAKGPAGAPVIGAAILAAMLVKRSWRPIARPGLVVGVLLAGAALTGLGLAIAQAAARAGPGAVTQSVGDFLWELRRLPGIAALPFAALAAGLPGSLALVFAWSPAGRDIVSPRQREAEPPGPGPGAIARGLAWTTLLSLAILCLAGVSNPRYTMPAMSLPAVLAAHAWAVAASGRDARGTKVWKLLTLGRSWALPALLVIAGLIFIPISEAQRERSSGRAAGRAIGELLPDHAQIWADHVVEARPEVLLYARARAEALGRRIEVRWMPASAAMPNPAPPAGQFVLLRGDAESGELARYRAAGIPLTEVWTGRVHKFECVLARVGPG